MPSLEVRAQESSRTAPPWFERCGPEGTRFPSRVAPRKVSPESAERYWMMLAQYELLWLDTA
jgi:hypothetical protein